MARLYDSTRFRSDSYGDWCTTHTVTVIGRKSSHVVNRYSIIMLKAPYFNTLAVPRIYQERSVGIQPNAVDLIGI